MSESVDLLLEVQRLDYETVQLLGKLSEARAALDEPAELRATRAELRRVEEDLPRLAAEQRSCEAEAAGLRAEAATLERRLYGDAGTNTRSIAALQAEIAHRVEQTRALEDKIVELMVHSDEQEAARRRLHDSIIALEALHAGRLPDLRAGVSNLEAQISATKSRRTTVASRVPAADLQVYRTLAATGKGRPVVRMVRGTCHGCGTTLPTAEAQKLRLSAGFPRCPRCGHIVKIE